MKKYIEFITEIDTYKLSRIKSDGIRMEEMFISLTHLNDLEIKFDFSDDYPSRLFYFYKKELILFFDIHTIFIIKKIWDIFAKFDHNLTKDFYEDPDNYSPFLNDMLHKHFNTDKIDSSESMSNNSCDYFESWFKNNWFNKV